MKRTFSLIAISFILFSLVLAPLTAKAESTAEKVIDLYNCVASPATCAAYGLSVLVSSIGARLIAAGALFTKVAFSYSINIVNSPVVEEGFRIALTLANLGFVIGIIIVALATIFRNQTYGVKQLLLRLVAMAVLVNFSLIIAGVMLNLSDQLAIFFINQASPDIQRSGDITAFSEKLAQAFAPQGLFQDPLNPNTDTTSNPLSYLFNQAGESAAQSKSGDFLQSLSGLLFTTIFTYLIAAAFLGLGLMFFLRYLWLTFLLILMPLAWLSWIFPNLKRHWQDWWKSFIKWAFFAPAMMFFIYLAVFVAFNGSEYMDKNILPLATQQDPNQNLAAQFGLSVGRPSNFVLALAKEIVVLGIIFGGLIAANKMGVTLAGATIDGVKSAGKWAQGATKRAAGRGAGRAARRAGAGILGGQGMADASSTLQSFGANRGAFLRTLSAPVRGLGQGIDSLRSQSRSVVADYEKIAKSKNAEQLVNQVGSKRGAELIAYLKAAEDKKVLSQAAAKVRVDAIDENVFKNYGEAKFFGEVRSVSGLAYKQADEDRSGVDKKKPEAEIDKDLQKTIRVIDGEKLAAFFGNFDENKKLLEMNLDQFKGFQREVARSALLGAPPAKIQKFLETANTDQVENFKKAAKEIAMDERSVNAQLLKWLRNSPVAQGLLDEEDLGIKKTVAAPRVEQPINGS